MPRRTAGDSDRASGRRLSRQRILEAALAVVDRDGLEGLSMRRLGVELGVEGMAVYYYFRNKSALLDELCDKLFAELNLEADPASDWSQRLRSNLTSFRDALRKHPNLVALVTSRPVLTPAALRATEVQYAALRSGGLDPKAVLDAHRTLGAYVFGYLMVEAQFVRSGLHESEFRPDFSFLTPANFPNTVELLPYQAGSDWDQQFQTGLSVILSGITSREEQPD